MKGRYYHVGQNGFNPSQSLVTAQHLARSATALIKPKPEELDRLAGRSTPEPIMEPDTNDDKNSDSDDDSALQQLNDLSNMYGTLVASTAHNYAAKMAELEQAKAEAIAARVAALARSEAENMASRLAIEKMAARLEQLQAVIQHPVDNASPMANDDKKKEEVQPQPAHSVNQPRDEWLLDMMPVQEPNEPGVEQPLTDSKPSSKIIKRKGTKKINAVVSRLTRPTAASLAHRI